MVRNSNNNSSGSGSGVVTILDPSQDPTSHYYVHPSEGPSSVSVTPQLAAKNYHFWARMMQRALIAKNKYRFVDGTLPISAVNYPHYFAWERCNNLVHSWIMNSISSLIGESVVFMENAIDVWLDLKE
ncbi:uncharacterized protein LOC109794017 [Cajanus cajan]|uniref:uncharacterized protein LOC109794017 n=1 Tax=Cajanus cajan TaxID=3821 RepID=UPI00098D8B2F|nr:uncharacterized protein LOC109794017 [Cajanus cajan]